MLVGIGFLILLLNRILAVVGRSLILRLGSAQHLAWGPCALAHSKGSVDLRGRLPCWPVNLDLTVNTESESCLPSKLLPCVEAPVRTALSLGAARVLKQRVRLSESPQGMATELGPAVAQRPPHAKGPRDGQG